MFDVECWILVVGWLIWMFDVGCLIWMLYIGCGQDVGPALSALSVRLSRLVKMSKMSAL